MRCSGSSFGVEGGERMPPNTRRREQRQLKWLHGVSRLIQQGECQHQPGSGAQGRRWQQRRLFAQQLFDRNFNGWLHPERSGSRFWRGLRWGGAGFVLAWVGPVFKTRSSHQLAMSFTNNHEGCRKTSFESEFA
jgi:hypothetical protein